MGQYEVILQIKVIVIAIVGQTMGNTNNASHPLPQIWERINTRYLRHRLTQEIIEENPLTLPSQEEQLAVITALKKRIALHHPSIAKVIYYRTSEDQSICQQFQSNYQILIYTEYTGDTLEKVIQQKGQRLYHMPCQCTHIISAAEYLKDHYGCFNITPNMIFLGNRKEKNTKVWINSKVEHSEREFVANQEDMCKSLCSLLRSLKINRFCKALTDEQIEDSYTIKRISQLKAQIFEAHRVRQDINRHKKSNSAVAYNHDRSQEFKPIILERNERSDKSETNKKNHNVKATSMPQKSLDPKQQKSFEILAFKPRDINDQNKGCSKISSAKNVSPQRPTQYQNPLKINFVYPQFETTRTITKPDQIAFLQQKQALLEITAPINLQDNTIQGQKGKVFQPKQPKKSLFDTEIDRMAFSLQQSNPKSFIGSPKHIDQPINNVNFTSQEMELPLQEAEEKTTPARLPTTSRSPKGLKEAQIKPIQEVPEITYSRYQKRISQQAGKTWKNKQHPISIPSSKSNKFQKYKDAIKSYEQKLRQKLADSVGTEPALIMPKNLLAVRKTTSSPKPTAECKQAKSVYNDSDEEQPISQSNNPKPEKPMPAVPFAQFDSEQSIPERDYGDSIQMDKKLEQIMNTKELTTKKMRQKLQKLQLEKQLQKQKIIIQNEMQDVFKQNAMREQYRSIRQKIKQKKQTFAQLKAEATKILEDLQF